MRARWPRLSLVSALLLGSGVVATPPASADPPCANGHSPQCTEAHVDDPTPDDPYGDALAPIDAGMGDTPADGNLAVANTCQRHPVRFTTDATGTDKRIQLVYVVPSNGTDRRLDQPQLCPNGTIFPHVLHNTYRNVSRFLWLEYQEMEDVQIRLRWPTHGYATGLGTPRVLARVAFLRDPDHTQAQWNQATPSTKLSWSKALLEANGFDNDNVIYLAVLEARQTTGGASRAEGLSNYNQALSTGCLISASGGCYAYMLVTGHWRDPDTSQDIYYVMRPGCANKAFDSSVLHEVSHVLGAVPMSAPSSDGTLHITTAQDVLLPGGYYLANASGGRIADYDASTDDYRTEVRRGWFTTDSPPDTSFRVCPTA